MDLEDHVLGTFKHVGRNIIKCLQREACLPIESLNKDNYDWSIPSSVVVSQLENRKVIPPEMLEKYLGLHYVHNKIQLKIPPSVLKLLGVGKLSLDQLVEIAKSNVRQFSEKEHQSSENIAWIGYWLSLVYTTLQQNYDCSQKTLEMLQSLNIFVLSDGTVVSLTNSVVFFPLDGNMPIQHSGKKKGSFFFLSRTQTIPPHQKKPRASAHPMKCKSTTSLTIK